MAKSTKTEPEEQPSTNDHAIAFFKQHAEDLFNHIVPENRFISSGSLNIDQFVKARSGGVMRLVAKTPESGKTSQGLVYLDQFMKTMPKSKSVYFMAEGRLSLELRERSGLKFVFDPTEWEHGTVLVMATNIFETVADFIVAQSKVMFDAGEHIAFMIDSLDGLILKNDKETKGITGDGKVAGVPKLTKLLFRHVALPIAFYDILLIITGQYSADISIDPYAPKIPRLGVGGGGSSVPHQCDYILEYQPRWGGDWIYEDDDAKPDPIKNKTLGVWVTVDIKKSATDTTGNRVKVPIRRGRIGCAIWVEKEVVDMAIKNQVIKRAGAWFNFDPSIIKEAKEAGITVKEKVQGLAALYDYIEQDKAVFEWLLAKFRSAAVSE